MAEPLKNLYNQAFISKLSTALTQVLSSFNENKFHQDIFTKEWERLELKERMRHISATLNAYLEGDFKNNCVQIVSLIEKLKAIGITEYGFEYMIFPDYIELYGLDHYEVSVSAMEKVTQFTSCEFAVRPFIAKYPTKMMDQMKQWSRHEHPMVRRLSSEGSRPRLPWAMALPDLKNNPDPIIPILETLKDDVSESVRRSVANNLNDISKDNPNVVIQLCNKWKGKNKETDWVVKHACRTLLKQGLPEIMKMFGFGEVEKIDILDFKITTPKVEIGEALNFVFGLHNTSKKTCKIRLEYGLYYMKANGSLSRKVFMISEKEYAPLSITRISRNQSFRLITTRKFHKGLHQVSLILNGVELEKYDFELV